MGIVQAHAPEGTMILLQITMVSPGIHLVKNHGSQSRTSESQLKRTNLKLKMLGPLCNQTVKLKTHSKTLYHSIPKLKYSPSILKHNNCLKKYASLNNSHNNCLRNYMNRIFLQIHKFRSINQSLCPIGCIPWIILRLWGFLCVNYCHLRRTQR